MTDGAAAKPTSIDTDTGLATAIRLLGRTSVLVVGDVMLDRYIYGAVERVSPEAPVPILTIERELAMLGGAGNVVRNLTALGAAVAFISVVGDDQAGSDLTGLIGGQPNVEPWLLVQSGRTTTLKTRFLASGQHLLRADREETTSIQPRLAERLLRIARDAMAATSVTVLSDYRKGLFSGELPAQLIAAAREAGRTVIVDPKGPDYSQYAGAHIIMPNRSDLAEATGMRVDNEAAVVAAATALRQRHGFGAVLVTRGNDGMTLLDDSGALHFPAEAVEVYRYRGRRGHGGSDFGRGHRSAAGAAGCRASRQYRGRRRGGEDRHRGSARGRSADGAVAAGRRTAQDRLARGGGGACAALASPRVAGRFHCRLLRQAGAAGPLPAGGGARVLRPTGGRAAIAAHRRNPTGGGARRHARQPCQRRSGHDIRRRVA